MKKAIVSFVDYCVEPEDVDNLVDLVLEKSDLVEETSNTITIDKSIFDDFQINQYLHIIFCDTEGDVVYKYVITSETPDTMTLELLDEYDIDIYIHMYRQTLPQVFEINIPKIEEEDIEDYVIDKISDDTGWLVNSAQFEVIDDIDDEM